MACKRILFILSFVNVFIAFYLYTILHPLPENCFLNTEQIIEKFGYEVKRHDVKIEEGFAISIFKMTSPKLKKSAPKPILFFGGCQSVSSLFILTGPKHDLAYILADEGFDVWLGNDRGSSVYSKPIKKENDSVISPEYFGFHEVAVSEIAVIIDFILKESGSKKVAFYGVSASSVAMLALLSTYPQYNDKISIVMHGGSAIFIETEVSWSYRYYLDALINYPGFYKFFGWDYFGRPYAIKALLKTRFGLEFLNKTFGLSNDIEVMTSATYQAKNDNIFGTMKHLFINTKRGYEFRMIDFGPENNLKLYNSTIPPLYDLSLVTAPSRYYFSDGDNVVDNKKTNELLGTLRNNLGGYSIKAPFSHINFVVDSNADKGFVNDFVTTLHKVT